MNATVTATVAVQLVARLRYLVQAPACACCGQIVDLIERRGEMLCTPCALRPVNQEPSS